MSQEVQVPPENQNNQQQQPENPSQSQPEGQGNQATNQNPPENKEAQNKQETQGEASQQEEQQIIEPKKEKGPYDIDEADMTPRFVRAMQVLGYAYDDLQHKDRKGVIDIIKTRDPLGNKINQELIDALSNHLENTRKQKIDAIRKERQYVPIPDKKQQSAVDQSRVQSSIAEKSIVLDKSIISMSNSILTKSLSPLELEFKLYDKMKKRERAELHRAKKDEEILSKQIEYQHRQQELDERLEKHRQIKQRQKHMQTQQQQEMLKWLHNRSDGESSNFNQAKQVVETLQKELKDTLKQRQLLNPREKIEKVKSMNDLRVKELEELQDKREKNMVERIERLQELSTKVDNEKHMRAFQDLQREIKGLLKQEKVQIRSEMLDEYHDFMKRQQQFDDSKRIKQVIKNKTFQEVEQVMYKKMLECKQQQLDEKLEKFKSLQTQSLKIKSSSNVQFPKHQSANNFGFMKAEYERRIGYQEDLIKEIERNDNIQARIRREEQQKLDIQMEKEAKRALSRDLEISKVASIVSDMKHLEHSNMASTKRKLASIKNQHQEIETRVIKEIEERRQKQEQDRQLQEKLEYEKKKERLRKQIDAHKEQLRIEEKQKQEQEQQQS